MINGLVAGILFLVWAWLGWTISDRVSSKEGRELFGLSWFASLLIFAASAVLGISNCGTIGEILVLWAMICAGFAITVVTLFLIAITLATLIVWVSSKVPDASVLDWEPQTETQKYLWVGAAVCFVLLCGWLGSLPSPFCE